ncbi:hypothetical protein O181_097408 [Austropuccinia psidii MF-1]|uniref:Uncharacterized protein n=1 Tax=Austropuccinia psidii MF-1 TaxID=1389203 RepID=A0A9Q3J7F4_9BASI|nr:hypothetical protein [Austropuccinia psidii MF-1]
MVHTGNESNYSVQPDGFGQGRGKTKSRSVKYSSNKTHLEVARVSPIPQGLNHLQVAEIEIYECQYKNWFRAAKEEEWEICASLWQGAINSYLHLKSFLGQENTIELLGGEGNGNDSSLETEGPVVSTSSKPAPEVPKDKPKGPQKKQRDPKNHQGKGKGKGNWHRPYPQGYRIPRLEPSAMNNVLNMARTLIQFTAKEKKRRNRTDPRK